MLRTRFTVLVFSFGMIVLNAGMVLGQNFPSKPLRIITGPVGGGSDTVVRLIAQGISGPLGQPVIVENRPTNLYGGIVSRASPDGYTLLLAGGGFLIGPLLQPLGYDPINDFSPITLAISQASMMVVPASLPVKSVKELIAYAKARPGELNYASGATGATTHLAPELFKAMTGVNIVRITYKNDSDQVADTIAGRVQLYISNPARVQSLVKSGRLTALGVTGSRRSRAFPDIPTIAEAGVPGYEVVQIQGLFAPARTSEVIIKRLNKEIVLVLNRADVTQTLFDSGVEVVASSAEELAAKTNSEIAKWSNLIKQIGIKDQ